MHGLLFRTRVAVLWMGVVLAMSMSLLLQLYAPGAVEELVAGEFEGEALTEATAYMLAVFGILPLGMGVASLLVADRMNRSMNLIGGLLFGLFGVFAVVSHVVTGGFTVHVLMVGLAGALAFMIAWLALAARRQAMSPAITAASEQIPPREKAMV